jgi:hypothetical protein
MEVYIVTTTFSNPDGTPTFCEAFGTMKEAQESMAANYLEYQEEYKKVSGFNTCFSDTRCFIEYLDERIDLEIHKCEFQVTVRL